MSRPALFIAAALAAALLAAAAQAQTPGAAPGSKAPFGPPIGEGASFSHLIVNEAEGRFGQGPGAFHWNLEGWTGSDYDRLWLKSEGTASEGEVESGRHEILYARPVSSFWNIQAGLRADLDSRRSRVWAALGVEGLAPYFIRTTATAYLSGEGRLGFHFEAADDLRLTQRLILEPRIEADLYTRDDAARRVGSGLSEIDAGFRLRYEITRKFAPYVGVAFERRFGRTADFARAAGERPDSNRFVVGLRSWL